MKLYEKIGNGILMVDDVSSPSYGCQNCLRQEIHMSNLLFQSLHKKKQERPFSHCCDWLLLLSTAEIEKMGNWSFSNHRLGYLSLLLWRIYNKCIHSACIMKSDELIDCGFERNRRTTFDFGYDVYDEVSEFFKWVKIIYRDVAIKCKNPCIVNLWFHLIINGNFE